MRNAIILAVFIGGIAAGVAVTALQPPQQEVASPYPALEAVPEPSAAAAVAAAVKAGDASSLAAVLDQEAVQGLGRAIGGVPIIDDVRFAGTAALGDSVLVGYIVTGSDAQGPSISGFTVTVDPSGKVVAIR
jgi:hypothetical protein